MNRSATISTVVLVMLAGLVPLAAQQGSRSDQLPAAIPQILPNRLIIKLVPGDQSPVERARALLAPAWKGLRLRSVSSWLHPGLLQPLPSGTMHKMARGSDSKLQELSRIMMIEYDGDYPADALATKIGGIPGIEYAEPVYRRALYVIPNDPYLPQQAYLGQAKAYEAWEIANADTSILIAIIDTGIDPGHPDLRNALWHNYEEMGTDGRGRDKRTNGVDDDNNGLVDDWEGYDFGGNDGYSPDNNPTPRYFHGTHVAGTAGATGNNNVGIAGIGFGARLMSIKISDDEAIQDPLLTGGANGILYAARMGAQIINCSWGGLGRSQAEQDLIDMVTDMGSLVVAAAGNEGSNLSAYPASYRNVLSVASVSGGDRRSFFSNFNIDVGISAPGERMFSTAPLSIVPSGYKTSEGTSMAAPVISGAAALVLAKYPWLMPEEIMAVLRSNADNIDAQNPAMELLLGSGRINIARAVEIGPEAVSASILDYRVIEATVDGVIEPGEQVELRARIKNILRPVSNLSLHLSPLTGQELDIENPVSPFGDLGRGQIRETSAGTFIMRMPGSTPIDYRLPLLLTLRDGDRIIGARRIELVVNPNYATTAHNRSTITFTGNGRIGYNDYPARTQGIGFRIDDSENLLAEGGMLIGVSPGQLADVVRSGNVLQQSQGLQTVEPYRVRFSDADGAEVGTARFNDQHLHPMQRIGLDIRMKTMQFNTPTAGNQTLVLYTITNTSLVHFSTLHCAWFLDWDIGLAGVNDIVESDLEHRLGYLHNVDNPKSPYVGAMVVSNEPMAFTALNGHSQPLINGFFQVEKWDAIASGIKLEQSDIGDASMVIGAGPIELAPGADTTVAFALMGGANLAELQESAQAAREVFARIGGTPGEPVVLPRELRLLDAYPNPFVSYTDLQFWLPKEDFVTIDVMNALGQKVQTVVSEFYPKGIHAVRFVPEVPGSGVYFVRLSALNRSIGAKVVRIVH